MKENLIIGVHGPRELAGGRYNVLSSFTVGLLKGFENVGAKVLTTKECFENNLTPNLTIGFNATGYETWAEYLNNKITNIMWSVDSVFYQNIEAIEKFTSYPNFVLFSVSPSDEEALRIFYPSLTHAYLPHAVDLNLWKKQDVEKEFDVVFLSSVDDYELKIQELSQTMPKQMFDLLMTFYQTWLSVPNMSFWQLYQLFMDKAGLNLDLIQCKLLFHNLVYLVSHTKRVQLIQSLKDFNVKVFGNDTWKKYVQGKVEYCGECDFLESINVINKSKIVLHSHPTQLASGLHERILNASAVETFVISSDTPSIQAEFGENMAYYNNVNFADIAEKLEYYLKNDEERVEKSKKAREIVKEKHTWDIRARQILGMISN